MIEIKIRCKGSHLLGLDELHILQDVEGKFQLKELTKESFDQLKRRLEKKGFWAPFFFWEDENGKKWYLDGTQRDKVLRWMEKRPKEYRLPEKYPASQIEAKDRTEAAEAILTISSRYGHTTEEGFYGLLHEYGLKNTWQDLKIDLDFPEFEMTEFDMGWMNDENAETNESPFDNFDELDYNDNYVSFKFGDYGGKVGRKIYDLFVNKYNDIREQSGEVMLDNILAEWLNV